MIVQVVVGQLQPGMNLHPTLKRRKYGQINYEVVI